MSSVLLVVAALAALALLVRGLFLGYGAPRIGTEVLSAKEQAIVCACADAILPHGGHVPLSASEAGVLEYFATVLRDGPRATALLIRLLLRLVEHGPWILGPAPRLTRQSAAARVATLCAWETSDVYFLRVAFTSLRTLVAMAYLAHPDVAARLGVREGNLAREARA